MVWVLALKVTDPDGAVALDEELELPADRTLRSPDGRYLLGLYGARFDAGRGLLEVVAGRDRDGRPLARVHRSDELDPYVPFTATLDRGRDRWTVLATLGLRYDPPPPGEPVDCPGAPAEQVTARELRADLPDGTGWTVAAGVPLAAGPDGTWLVDTGGLAFAVAAADGDLGPPSAPSASFPTADAPLVLPPGAIGATKRGEVRWSGKAPLPIAGISGARDPIVTVRVPCAEVRMHVDPTTLVIP